MVLWALSVSLPHRQIGAFQKLILTFDPVKLVSATKMRRLAVLLGLPLSSLACGASTTPSPSSAPFSAGAESAPASRKPAPASQPEHSDALLPEVGNLYLEPMEDAPEPAPPELSSEAAPLTHPLDGKSQPELERMVVEAPETLGPMSVGRPSGGILVNGIQLPEDERWKRVDPENAWATEETIRYLRTAIDRVKQRYPNAPKLHIGHISAQGGGHLTPHLSHQSGRDVDVSYFYADGGRWYVRGTRENLDLNKTWAFVRALIGSTDVEMILIDHSIQALLKQHALEIGEDPNWLKSVFRGGSGRRPIIRHARGHASHMHIRFYNPIAQETARRAYPFLVEHDVIKPPTYYVRHRVRSGETLGKLARRYGTTVKAIQRANGLRSTKIIAKKTYRIPRTGPAAQPKAPLSFPERRIPPDPEPSPKSAHKSAEN